MPEGDHKAPKSPKAPHYGAQFGAASARQRPRAVLYSQFREDAHAKALAQYRSHQGVHKSSGVPFTATEDGQGTSSLEDFAEDGSSPASRRVEALDPPGAERDRPKSWVSPAADMELDSTVLDLRSVMRAIWTYRTMVLCLVAVGMVGGVIASLAIPKKYSAISTLYFDPSSIRTTDEGKDVSVPAEVMKATIESHTKIISLENNVREVVKKLKLAKDPAFAGRTDDEVAMALQQAIKITRPEETYIAEVKVTTASPDKSARIANALVETFVEREQRMQIDKYSMVDTALQGRLDDLRRAVEVSENAVAKFRSENDLIEAEGDLIADKRLTALNELLVKTRQTTIEAKSKLETASRIDVRDVVNGTLKEDVATNTLSSLRVQYANLSSNLGRLESQMGSRHPSLIAAKASVGMLEKEIRNELSRMVASAKDEYGQALKNEQDLIDELATQKALQSNTSPEMVELKQLERKAKVDKEIYEAALKRAGQTAEEKKLLQNSIRVVSPAVPPILPDGPGRMVLMIAGLFGGFMLGFGLGTLGALVRDKFEGAGGS